MKQRILVANELRTLLSANTLTNLDVTWLGAGDPLPSGDFVAIVPLLTRCVGAAEFDQLPNLKIVANCAVGYDNVDVAEAKRRSIAVTNTPDALTDATADFTWALILAAARGLVAAEQVLRTEDWQGWHPAEFLGLELSGATLGVVGAGRIGQAVGRRAVAFGMKVRYTARSPKPDFEQATGAERRTLDELLSESDVVTLHLPSTPGMRGFMSGARFGAMKPGAVFVNTARGDLVDEDALVSALTSGHLRAAALDVFQGEPKLNPRLFTAPRLLLAPHMASATEITRHRMAERAVANAKAVLAGKAPLDPVVR